MHAEVEGALAGDFGEAARRVLAGEFRAGFQTPATLFGSSFATTIADTRITDL